MHYYSIIALILAVVIGVAVFITRKREGFSDYNAPNDFMKIYYSSIAQDPAFDKKFPFFGTKNKSGLRCRFPNNKGCDTIWISGQLVELTPKLKKSLECKFQIQFDD
jgi:hypothetical protein